MIKIICHKIPLKKLKNSLVEVIWKLKRFMVFQLLLEVCGIGFLLWNNMEKLSKILNLNVKRSLNLKKNFKNQKKN
jgi:hypothetical protein